MNNVNIIGRLTKDVELRKTSTNKSVSSFSIAVDNLTKKDGEKTTSFFNCNAWDSVAETLSKFTRKGDRIAISGSLIQRNYETKNGVKNSVVEINVNSITLIENKKENTSAAKENKPVENDNKINDDDLPF